MQQRSFFIRTFGCQMNVLDSEKVAGLLVSSGWVPAERPEEADFILFNTCSVREKAAQRVYAHVASVKSLKKTRPGLVLGVMGCVAQQEGETMLRQAPGLDLVVGTRRYQAIPGHLERILSGEASSVVDVHMEGDTEPAEVETTLRESPFRAFVTVMEGCDNFCSYCVVPHTRGRERSRSSAGVLEEIRRLVESGVVEVMLLGQNVNSYRDPSPAGMDFADLLLAVAEIPGLARLRFTTSHPKDFTPRLLGAMMSSPVICRQLHLPAQSGSTRILSAMNRKYSREGYLALIGLIRNAPHYVSLSSDFITGFPGETEEDFQETLSLLEAARYDSIFSFAYSPRPQTAALKLAGTVPEELKLARLQGLQMLQTRIQRENNEAALGTVQRVLVDGTGREPGQLSSRNEANQIVHFQGDASLIGTFTDVRIIRAGTHSLGGECL